MSIKRYLITYTPYIDNSMSLAYVPSVAGVWVRYDDHAAEVERLTAEVDPENLHFVMSHPEAVARQMTRDATRIEELEREVAQLTAELDEALDDLVVVRALVSSERARRKKAEAALEGEDD